MYPIAIQTKSALNATAHRWRSFQVGIDDHRAIVSHPAAAQMAPAIRGSHTGIDARGTKTRTIRAHQTAANTAVPMPTSHGAGAREGVVVPRAAPRTP